ncbi:hypothetical protein [Rubrivirga sp.]|uniref:hypothetical protein n=1 Tax=Rubrivirga sp. TaxID=1885344 RepID=UPI003C74BA6A
MASQDEHEWSGLEDASSRPDVERRFWWSQTPDARLREVQRLRELTYGDAAKGHVDRSALEVGTRGPDGKVQWGRRR